MLFVAASTADDKSYRERLVYQGHMVDGTIILLLLLTPGAHAQRGLLTVVGLCVCLSVCLSVDDYSRTTGYEAAYERYQQLQCYKGMKKMWRFC